ncbi:MAG TPA: DUF2867 domain-containing protein [Paracoccaceae bacterium]|nr:DUF2867 domain-containing protein [Paracoccaceae bacterium]
MPAASIPANAPLVAPAERLHFLHVGETVLSRPLTALEVWDISTAQNLPFLPMAFRIRDAISGLFGVAPIRGLQATRPAHPKVGDRLAFFTVAEVRDDLLNLVVRDGHLDVMNAITTDGCRVQVTASVRVHNLFGHIYMLPVRPAHRLIVWAMLRRLKTVVAAEAG